MARFFLLGPSPDVPHKSTRTAAAVAAGSMSRLGPRAVASSPEAPKMDCRAAWARSAVEAPPAAPVAVTDGGGGSAGISDAELNEPAHTRSCHAANAE